MNVRRTILCLAAAFLWATYDPDMASAQSSELMAAYNSYNTLYQQGRNSEAEPYAKEALKLGTQEFGPNDPTTAAFVNNLALLYGAQGHVGIMSRPQEGGGKAENRASPMHGFRPFSGRHRNRLVRTAYLILTMKTSFGTRR